jgi:hypothetical protein
MSCNKRIQPSYMGDTLINEKNIQNFPPGFISSPQNNNTFQQFPQDNIPPFPQFSPNTIQAFPQNNNTPFPQFSPNTIQQFPDGFIQQLPQGIIQQLSQNSMQPPQPPQQLQQLQNTFPRFIPGFYPPIPTRPVPPPGYIPYPIYPCINQTCNNYTDISLCMPGTITFNSATTSVSISITSSACGTFIYSNGSVAPFSSTLPIAPSNNLFSTKIVEKIPDNITLTFDTFTYLTQSYTPAVITLDKSTTTDTITTVLTGTAGGSITLIVIYIYCGTNWTVNDILLYPN